MGGRGRGREVQEEGESGAHEGGGGRGGGAEQSRAPFITRCSSPGNTFAPGEMNDLSGAVPRPAMRRHAAPRRHLQLTALHAGRLGASPPPPAAARCLTGQGCLRPRAPLLYCQAQSTETGAPLIPVSVMRRIGVVWEEVGGGLGRVGHHFASLTMILLKRIWWW